VHITELRNAINDARARAELSAASWAEAVTPGVTVKASHITEMRAALNSKQGSVNRGQSSMKLRLTMNDENLGKKT
jgi:hypothetical protein